MRSVGNSASVTPHEASPRLDQWLHRLAILWTDVIQWLRAVECNRNEMGTTHLIVITAIVIVASWMCARAGGTR